MGWGTEFTTDIFLNKKNYISLFEVQEQIDENNRGIESYKKKIMMFASSNMRDIVDLEWKDEPINWLYNQINELQDTIDELTIETYMLELYVEYINEQCGGHIKKLTNENE